ncbi:hypothetical protein RD792_017075 [Penstemon davidsonii]|uniref:Two-component response regulator n=1 Tax=Penstemon davidsonii TaxID=160366 RepID=A0ABR0CLT6_9LAMI|nr:hypothetical protein RD792_017075 [Penstemon davidsonii]
MNLGINFTCSSSSWKSNDKASDQFPAGLRVLVVDDDPTCLRILEKMLRNFLYEVTKCNRAEIALNLLRDNKNGYDVVLSDVHMPDMDGFKLLELVGLEMDLPILMMSADDSMDVILKGVTHGACDYLIKPVRMEALKNIWQHVVRKRKYEWKEKDFEQSGSFKEGEKCQDRNDTSELKKPRVVWSVELHQQFVNAVNQLGIDKAVPKKILELMNVPGLTRENVASHLQKFRLYLRRLSSASPHQNALNNSFKGPSDPSFLNGLDFQALAASGRIPPQSLATLQAATLPVALVDQRNIFSFENPQQRNNNGKQVNLLHGIPTNMDSKQLANLQQSAYMSQSNLVPSHMVQPQPRTLLNDIAGTLVSRNGIDLSRSNSEIRVSKNVVPNYGVYIEINENRNQDWTLQNVGSIYGSSLHVGPDVLRPVLVEPGFSSKGQSSIPVKSLGIDQQFNSSLADNSLRVKAEMGFENGLYSGHFGQDDLKSAILKHKKRWYPLVMCLALMGTIWMIFLCSKSLSTSFARAGLSGWVFWDPSRPDRVFPVWD